jgi:hypothetical protein
MGCQSGAVVRLMFEINISACHFWGRGFDSQSDPFLMWSRWQPVHTAPSTPLTRLGIHYDSISDSTLRQGGRSGHTVGVWQVRKLQQDSNRTVNHQLTWHSHPILNKPRLLSLILARLPVSQQWTSAIHLWRPTRGRCTDELTPSK